MQYPLLERIGDPRLLAGRAEEFAFFHQWIARIPKRLFPSHAILARKKSGKTGLVQRLFNELWSAKGTEQDHRVIPFYFEIKDQKLWHPNFATQYYQVFASQYISYLEREQKWVRSPLSLKEIQVYGKKKKISLLVEDVEQLIHDREMRNFDHMWELAYTAPHRFAGVYQQFFLVILDEFQNISRYIYVDEAKTICDETMAGSFHEHAESKVAPMLVTGSYVGWLSNVIDTYLEGGRLRKWRMSPYLRYEEGIEAVYRYAEAYDELVSNESAILINQLCLSDPFFIACVFQSQFREKDLSTWKGVVKTVDYELTNSESSLSHTWGEYIDRTVSEINDKNAKSLLLFLNQHREKNWTPQELKKKLQLDLSPSDIHRKLRALHYADLVEKGTSDIDFRGLKDGTLSLVLRTRFEKEIHSFSPDWQKEFNQTVEELQKKNHSLQGMLNQLSGHLAEEQLANDLRQRKTFPLSIYFDGVEKTNFDEIEKIDSNSLEESNFELKRVLVRVPFQGKAGKNWEIDIVAKALEEKTLLIEVKKLKKKVSLVQVKEFLEKATAYQKNYPEEIYYLGYLSMGGFTQEAQEFCKIHQIGLAISIPYLEKEWSS